ncbi:MAG TPA: YkgJ family cysteine cluster protein [Alphaproteobacteria bacterium]|nr:YkgJ family cysteine cluster protein [Alphaproteobacteria bacterium]
MTALLVDDPRLPFADRAHIATREAAAAVMGDKPRPADLLALAAEAAVLAESLAPESRRLEPPQRPIACRAGCGHCCHTIVMAIPAEVLRLAAHIQRRFTPAARAALIERLRAVAAVAPPERLAARMACPMLADDRCTVYEARPLKCRGLESMDVEVCKRGARGEAVEVPVYAAHHRLFDRVLSGLIVGAIEAGRPDERLDLVRGLLIALETPDAARRWLAGEPVFATARLE